MIFIKITIFTPGFVPKMGIFCPHRRHVGFLLVWKYQMHHTEALPLENSIIYSDLLQNLYDIYENYYIYPRICAQNGDFLPLQEACRIFFSIEISNALY